MFQLSPLSQFTRCGGFAPVESSVAGPLVCVGTNRRSDRLLVEFPNSALVSLTLDPQNLIPEDQTKPMIVASLGLEIIYRRNTGREIRRARMVTKEGTTAASANRSACE